MNEKTLSHNSTDDMVRYAHFVLDTIRRVGLRTAATEHLEGWEMAGAGYARHPMGYAGYGHGKAGWEVIIEHESRVSLILRDYGTNGEQRRATWAIGSNENIGIDRAMAEMTNYYCQKSPEAEAEVPAETTYEQWDAQRRELYDAFNPSYDNVDVVHNEYETAVYYGASGGRVVASWCCATGTCTIQTIEQLADELAADVRNYIINAHHDGDAS